MTSWKSSLLEITITSSSLYTTNCALRSETCCAMKCVTFNYSQGRMNELPDWLAMILLAAEVFTCIMGPAVLDKTAVTGNYTNCSRIASKFSKYHLLDVPITFKLNDFACTAWWMKHRLFVYTEILWTKKYHRDCSDLVESEKVFWLASIAK